MVTKRVEELSNANSKRMRKGGRMKKMRRGGVKEEKRGEENESKKGGAKRKVEYDDVFTDFVGKSMVNMHNYSLNEYIIPTYINTAKLALEEYNREEGTDFKLMEKSEVQGNRFNERGHEHMWHHVNFSACEEDGEEEEFFGGVRYEAGSANDYFKYTNIECQKLMEEDKYGNNICKGCRAKTDAVHLDHPPRGFAAIRKPD
ncbi:hypothetical protein Tsubulata_015370 [Turnera subulata]|uniref:DUF3615 domain-containing protein n=1 Tax=Turnera subulata TaxID=218843 RepID=A0A9Q0GCL5_9ROSI|nr:hypothetical protein Tsubulata_015370 [Turnera subulata]